MNTNIAAETTRPIILDSRRPNRVVTTVAAAAALAFAGGFALGWKAAWL